MSQWLLHFRNAYTISVWVLKYKNHLLSEKDLVWAIILLMKGWDHGLSALRSLLLRKSLIGWPEILKFSSKKLIWLVSCLRVNAGSLLKNPTIFLPAASTERVSCKKCLIKNKVKNEVQLELTWHNQGGIRAALSSIIGARHGPKNFRAFRAYLYTYYNKS